MKNLRLYGTAPYALAVVHGGPGAPGEMAPVARELGATWGVLEPLQTATSLEAQVDELTAVLKEYGNLPITLIGFSWGAWLSLLVTARHPELAAKLILIGSGSLEEKYTTDMQAIRSQRLSEAERAELPSVLQDLEKQGADAKRAFTRLGALFSKADAYDPIPAEAEIIDYQVEIYRRVWPEAADLRKRGDLVHQARRIRCPVVAIHGEDDPHPAEGVREPLSSVLPDFRFVMLARCGHKPWIEKQARDHFFEILHSELNAEPALP